MALSVAVAASLALSLAQTRKYTARVALVIEAPGSSDPRAALAVSPIYLESLRTYEHFASSDHLFAQAVEKFNLRGKGDARPIEGLKRSVLRVSIPRNTKILELSVTLPDAKKAHDLALYLAEQTMNLSREAARAGDVDMIEAAQGEAAIALARTNATREALAKAMRRSPDPVMLNAEIGRLRDRHSEIERLALAAELSAADQADREKSASNPESARNRLRATRARAERLRNEQSKVIAESARLEKLLAERKSEIDLLSAEHKLTQDSSELAERRVRDLKSFRGSRTERISLLDPGFVPERPSSPNVPLNVLVAVGLALIASLIYLTLEWAFRSQRSGSAGLRRIAVK
jgi:capsular polysaccharide biosynthesis protein